VWVSVAVAVAVEHVEVVSVAVAEVVFGAVAEVVFGAVYLAVAVYLAESVFAGFVVFSAVLDELESCGLEMMEVCVAVLA
jgi:hypothetical protein